MKIKEWPGLFIGADPHDLPPGAAVVQNNLMSLYPGKLEVRRGYVALAGTTAIPKTLFRFHTADLGDKIFIHEGTATRVYSYGSSAFLENGIVGTSSFAQTRKGWVIRVTGEQRGSIWDQSECWQLGFTGPSVKPTISVAYAGGSAYQDVTYWFGYNYRDDNGCTSPLSPCESKTTTGANGLFSWTITAPTETSCDGGTVRATYIDLYRSLADDPSVMYLIASLPYGSTSYTNDGAPDSAMRENQALPILYNDGQLCARRQVAPPTTCAVCVPYIDRYWYGVQASGGSDERNKLYYSCPGEPESVPSDNVLEVLGDPADPDDMTALFSHNSNLFVAKTRHIYRVQYGSDPRYNATCRLVAARGALNQSCIDFFGDQAYCLDQMGPWRMTGDGSDDAFAQPVRALWTEGYINYARSSSFQVAIDVNQHVVRYFVTLNSDGAISYPTRALCYSMVTQAWWWETYPVQIHGRCRFDISGRFRTIVGCSYSMLTMGEGTTDEVYQDNAWNGAAISYQYRSGPIDLPPPKDNAGRINRISVSLTFEPTYGADEVVSMKFYNDHDLTPTTWGVTDEKTSAGGTSTRISMGAIVGASGGLASALYRNPGVDGQVIQRRVDPRMTSHQFLSVELTGQQIARQQLFYSIDLDVVDS